MNKKLLLSLGFAAAFYFLVILPQTIFLVGFKRFIQNMDTFKFFLGLLYPSCIGIGIYSLIDGLKTDSYKNMINFIKFDIKVHLLSYFIMTITIALLFEKKLSGSSISTGSGLAIMLIGVISLNYYCFGGKSRKYTKYEFNLSNIFEPESCDKNNTNNSKEDKCVENKLHTIKALHEKGLVTAEEYEKTKARILGNNF